MKNTKLSNCTLTFSFSPWKVSWGDADSKKRRSARCAPRINVHKEKDKKKSTVYQQICIILFSLLYSQSATFPRCDSLNGEEKGLVGKGVQVSRPDLEENTPNESSQKVQTCVFKPISLLFLPFFLFYFSTGAPVLSRCLCSALRLTAPCGHTEVRVSNTAKQWHQKKHPTD